MAYQVACLACYQAVAAASCCQAGEVTFSLVGHLAVEAAFPWVGLHLVEGHLGLHQAASLESLVSLAAVLATREAQEGLESAS